MIEKTKEQVLNRLRELLAKDGIVGRKELAALKYAYFSKFRDEAVEAYNKHIESGADPEAFVPPIDTTESEYKELMRQLRVRRAEAALEEERLRADNLSRKMNIISSIRQMIDTADGSEESFAEFKALLAEWNNIGDVPPEHETALWHTYRICVEHFYDYAKIDCALRENDFYNNMKIRADICKKAEYLAGANNVVFALRSLQPLMQAWKETGPVAIMSREKFRKRFHDACTVINKRCESYFVERKANFEESEARREDICRAVERISFDTFTSSRAWAEATKEIQELQIRWKQAGIIPRDKHAVLQARFNAACNHFFEAKSDWHNRVHERIKAGINVRLSICDQAEALSDSTGWAAAMRKFRDLQQQWQQAEFVPRRVNEELRGRYHAAYKKFINRRKMALKKPAQDAGVHEAVKPQPSDLENNIHRNSEQHTAKFQPTTHQKTSTPQQPVLQSRTELVYRRDKLSQELATYENNVGFFSSKTKPDNSLVNYTQQKIKALRDEIARIDEQIKALDASSPTPDTPHKAD